MQIEGYEAELKTLFGKLIKDEINDSYIHSPPPEGFCTWRRAPTKSESWLLLLI